MTPGSMEPEPPCFRPPEPERNLFCGFGSGMQCISVFNKPNVYFFFFSIKTNLGTNLGYKQVINRYISVTLDMICKGTMLVERLEMHSICHLISL